MDMPDRRDAGVKSVHLTIDILEVLTERDSDIGVSEIAVKLGTTKGTVFRHLQTLLERGYIAQNPLTQRYNLGPQSVVLGKIAAERVDIAALAETPLKILRDETGETAIISLVDAQGIMVLLTILSQSPLEIGVRPGSRLASYCTAQGKILLAYGASSHMAQLRRRGMEMITSHTLPSIERLEQQLEDIRRDGFADAPNEETLGINALAAPVFDGSNKLIATVAIVGSVMNIAREAFPAKVEAVKNAADTISRALGYRNPRPGEK